MIPVQERRAAAVLRAQEAVRAMCSDGVTPAELDGIKRVIGELAERDDLFPREQFPLGANDAPRVYYLAQDPGGEFALYASAGAPGKSQPPHNHTTWAVISGVYGEEHNVLYRRTDDRSRSGEGALERTGEVTVRRGNAVGLLPDDFHTIRVIGNEYALHIHAYGRSLEQLPGRITFEGTAGGRYKTFPANPNIASPRISAADLKALLRSTHECALIDVRREREYAKGHPLFACSVPVETFEARIVKLVPPRATAIVLYDDGDGEQEAACAVLRRLGYANVSVLDGGVAAWKNAGYELFSGFNVPSKAFGEIVERAYATPRVSARELRAMLDEGKRVAILDSRTPEEFGNMSLPGAVSCPGAELLYRVHEVVPDDVTTVIVNCAGRTRSIIGAQSLLNAGVRNPVVALENGTMGWQLAGLALEHGSRKCAGQPSEPALARAREEAIAVARRFGVRTIDIAALEALRRERDRTLYVFDVRLPEEYRAGHLPGSRSAPGGQLVQATDAYVAVRNARIVLVDGDGVRARMTASWLLQMGAGEVFVLDPPPLERLTESGDEPGWMPQFAATTNKPYHSPEAMRAYIEWETGLVQQIQRDGDAPFARLIPA